MATIFTTFVVASILSSGCEWVRQDIFRINGERILSRMRYDMFHHQIQKIHLAVHNFLATKPERNSAPNYESRLNDLSELYEIKQDPKATDVLSFIADLTLLN